MATTTKSWPGLDAAFAIASEQDAREFHIQQLMNKMATATLVKVVKNTVAGIVGPVGFVDVVPLVNMLDGNAKAYEHGTVFSLPYFRMQGGAEKAIIMDPKVGDVGMVVFADRDISAVKRTKKQSNPGSRRRFDMADGMFVGCYLGGTPTCYLQFTDDDKIVASPDGGTTLYQVEAGKITLKATTITLESNDIRLGGDTAIRPVSASGTSTSDGATDTGNFLTAVKGL